MQESVVKCLFLILSLYQPNPNGNHFIIIINIYSTSLCKNIPNSTLSLIIPFASSKVIPSKSSEISLIQTSGTRTWLMYSVTVNGDAISFVRIPCVMKKSEIIAVPLGP